ncbi:MAG: helix-turn-helix transcriptional regulator [Flavobacteriales bacterium]
MNTPEFIPENLKAARLLLGLSQAELSDLSGVQQKDISLHENKTTKTLIPVRYMLVLVEKGIDLNSLFTKGPVRMLTKYSEPRTASIAAEQHLVPASYIKTLEARIAKLEHGTQTIVKKRRTGGHGHGANHGG